MNRINYNMKEHGFVGHLSIPEQSTKYGVIVIMGGEQSVLPGTLIADRFADYGIAALADLKLYETEARILLIAGTGDEAWPSDYSA